MQSAGTDARPGAGGGLRRLLRVVTWLFSVAVAAVLIVAIGFVWFLHLIPETEKPLTEKADGIVVLTGGASRIEDAIELLALGGGQRLLISGVNRRTSDREIARLRPEFEKIVQCCVDLDRSAVNTTTNATETKRWVESRGFRSLIVVTSSYHMPRAMAELSHQLPNTALIAFPVISDTVKASWAHGPTLRLLFSEYVKYMVAVARMQVPAIDRLFA